MGNGDICLTQEELNALVAKVHNSGYQAAVHAIGDRAVEQALTAFELVLEGQPNTLPPAHGAHQRHPGNTSLIRQVGGLAGIIFGFTWLLVVISTSW